MPSTYSSNLRVELMASGEQSTVWGQKTNTNLELLEAAISEMATIATTGGTTVLTALDGADDQARKAVLKITGTLVSNATLQIPAVTKWYLVWNATSGAYTVTIKTAGGVGQTVTANQVRLVYCDGTDVFNLVANSVSGGTVGGTASGLTYNMASNTFTGTLAQFNAAISDADVTSAADLASTASGKGASLVGVQDAAGFFPSTVTQVEQALAMLGSAHVVSVKDPRYGAVGDGVTDDTAAIQAAITAAVGGATVNIIYFPPGVYKVTSALTSTGPVILRGAGELASEIKTNSATAHLINFDCGTGTWTGCGIEHLRLSSSVARTAGSYIRLTAAATGSHYKAHVRNVTMDANTFIGLDVNACFVLSVRDVRIDGVKQNGTGFNFQGIGVGNTLAHLYMSNCLVASGVAGATTKGYHFGSYVEGVYALNLVAESSGLNYGFVFDDALASSDRSPKNMWFNSCVADSTVGVGWLASSGENVHLSSCWAASCTGSGVSVGADCVDWTVSDFSALANGTQGIVLDGCATMKVCNSSIIGNSAASPGTNPGIGVTAGTSDFIITGNRFSRRGSTPSHSHDIKIDTGASDKYVVADNILDGYTIGPFFDAGAGATAQAHHNIGVAPGLTFVTVGASPYTYTAGHRPESLYIIGGTVSAISTLGQTMFSATDKVMPLHPNQAVTVTYSVLPALVSVKQ